MPTEILFMAHRDTPVGKIRCMVTRNGRPTDEQSKRLSASGIKSGKLLTGWKCAYVSYPAVLDDGFTDDVHCGVTYGPVKVPLNPTDPSDPETLIGALADEIVVGWDYNHRLNDEYEGGGAEEEALKKVEEIFEYGKTNGLY